MNRQSWIIVSVYVVFCVAIFFLLYRFMKKKQKSWDDMTQKMADDTKEHLVKLYSDASSKVSEQLYEDVKGEVIETITRAPKASKIEEFVEEPQDSNIIPLQIQKLNGKSKNNKSKK